MHIAITWPIRSNQVDAQQVVAQNYAGNAVASDEEGRGMLKIEAKGEGKRHSL